MNKQLVIENYLAELEKELSALPTGTRAEILTEIRSHILEASENQPNRNIQAILDDFGSASSVARRYYAEKGMTYVAPTRPKWMRRLAYAVVGVFAFFLLSTIFTIWYFSPLIQVDEAAGRVRILGGLIDVNEKLGEVKVGSVHINGVPAEETAWDDADTEADFSLNVSGVSENQGDADLKTEKVTRILIPFNTAKLELIASKDSHFRWSCKNVSNAPPPLTVNAGVMTFDLNAVNLAKCDLHLPEGVKAELKGVNGALDIEKPASDLDINVTNAKINIEPDRSRVYDFEVKVVNGVQDKFGRSSDTKAVKVKVDVVNGVVRSHE